MSRVSINLGCGTSAVPGWHNLDNSPTILLSRLPLLGRRFAPWPKDVRRCNALKGLPFAGDSVDHIYSSHMFEHLTWEQSLVVAKECFRVLRPGGVLRIAVPDLRTMIERYQRDSSDNASQGFVASLHLRGTWRDILHPGANHAQMFDARSLLHLLRQAGFRDPQSSKFGSSRIPDIAAVELLERKGESIYAEAVK